MNMDLPALLARFSGLHVLVVGDAMLDSYLEGAVERICREAPVPAVALRRRSDAPGGAANTAANIVRLGARATLIALIGDDAEGALLCRALRERGLETSALAVEPGRVTLAKHRVIADGQLL